MMTLSLAATETWRRAFMTTTFVSFYTPAYRAHAERLVASLVAHGLKHDVEPVEQERGWCATCANKAAFIQRKRHEYRGAVVWLDADATVERHPRLLVDGFDADVAVHYRKGHELLSGTLWIGDTSRSRQLMDQWKMACEHDPATWDQRHLQNTIEAGTYDVRRLPAGYVSIFDANMSDDPVITHWQASRVMRGMVGE